MRIAGMFQNELGVRAFFTTKPGQHNADLLFRRILFACRPLDVFDDLLARDFACSGSLSHRPLLGGYDEPETLSYQISLFGPTGADVRQASKAYQQSHLVASRVRGMNIYEHWGTPENKVIYETKK